MGHIRTTGIVLLVVGIVTLVLSLVADPIGIGDSAGLGRDQIVDSRGMGPSTSTTTTCTGLQMLIPLYIYPTTDNIWDKVAMAGGQIPITAIINPCNGPLCLPCHDNCYDDYRNGISNLRNAGVTTLGYVHTCWGNQTQPDPDHPLCPKTEDSIKGDIDAWYTLYPMIDGIFFDEVASSAGECEYYQGLYEHVKSLHDLAIVIINAHAPDECYISRPACDTANIFEDCAVFVEGKDCVSDWPSFDPDPYVSDYPAERFAMLAHTVPDTDTMQSHIDLAVVRNVGYVYLTDDTLVPDGNPWDTLPTFWQAEIEHIASFNVCPIWLPIILKSY